MVYPGHHRPKACCSPLPLQDLSAQCNHSLSFSPRLCTAPICAVTHRCLPAGSFFRPHLSHADLFLGSCSAARCKMQRNSHMCASQLDFFYYSPAGSDRKKCQDKINKPRKTHPSCIGLLCFLDHWRGAAFCEMFITLLLKGTILGLAEGAPWILHHGRGVVSLYARFSPALPPAAPRPANRNHRLLDKTTSSRPFYPHTSNNLMDDGRKVGHEKKEVQRYMPAPPGPAYEYNMISLVMMHL